MIRAILAALLLTGCAAFDAIERATLPPPTDCAFYGVRDYGGMICETVKEIPLTRRQMDEVAGERVWGVTRPEGRHCVIYYVGERARRHELAHVHCGRFHIDPSWRDRSRKKEG